MMMNSARPFLIPALALSLALHAALIFVNMRAEMPKERAQRPSQAELTVTVRLPDAPAAPRLILPELQRNAGAVAAGATVRPRSEAPARVIVASAAPPADSPRRLAGEAALKAAEQMQRGLPYPPEAIERGLQGEALVLLFLDQAGNVVAARLESSSGHALLDDAAVRAARGLRALPDSAPREALLPVRFRLR
jgi:periplasmic protein TonB